MTVSFTIPLRTEPGQNAREHWRVAAKRIKREKEVTAWHAGSLLRGLRMPCVVTLTRLSSGTLDTDNLAGSMKGVRDAVAKLIGVDDGDVSRVQYRYAQEKVKRGTYGVRVDVEENARLVERVERQTA